jgi:hypothetical protein
MPLLELVEEEAPTYALVAPIKKFPLPPNMLELALPIIAPEVVLFKATLREAIMDEFDEFPLITAVELTGE